MFRMLKLNPPNGWRAVAWELAIVTAGVLIALAVQQWAEERSWNAKATHSTSAIRRELADHYYWSVEWRVVNPCLIAQIDRLKQRVLTSGPRLEPAPTFSERDFSEYVLRLPSKDYVDIAWQSAIADGVSAHLNPTLREELSAHYVQAQSLVPLTARNADDAQGLFSLSQPLPLDPMVRFTLLRTLDELRGRFGFIDLQSGQLIEHIAKVGMIPSAVAARAEVERYGTYKFCRSQRLPLRSFLDAMKPVAN